MKSGLFFDCIQQRQSNSCEFLFLLNAQVFQEESGNFEFTTLKKMTVFTETKQFLNCILL